MSCEKGCCDDDKPQEAPKVENNHGHSHGDGEDCGHDHGHDDGHGHGHDHDDGHNHEKPKEEAGGHEHASGGGCCGGGPKLSAKRERFENSLANDEGMLMNMKEMNKELMTVVNFIMDQDELKVKISHLEGFGKVNFFRGVNFHLTVLKYGFQIMDMIPTLVKEERITQLKSIEDSEALGQYLLACECLDKLQLCVQEGDACCGGPGTEKQSEKKPDLLELAGDQEFTTEKSYYVVRQSENEQFMQSVYLVLGMISFMALFLSWFSFNFWPEKYKIMSFESFYYGITPLLLVAVIPVGIYRGGPKRLAGILLSLIIMGGIGYLASESEKEKPLEKVTEALATMHDMSYLYVIGKLPSAYDQLKKKGKKKKKKGKKSQQEQPKQPQPTHEEIKRAQDQQQKQREAQEAERIYKELNKKKKKTKKTEEL